MWKQVGTHNHYATLPRAIDAFSPVRFSRYGQNDTPADAPSECIGRDCARLLLNDGNVVFLTLVA